ncbi:hypothetical protein KFU94_07510 [Chloroflexi bacterium TSY]|nr:hypothetical protein [Chloroflexi bacterium TSY]
MKKLFYNRFCFILFAIMIVTGVIHPFNNITSVVYAHGGVIIDGGFTDEYEWLVAINPFPLTPGETVLTLLVYDIKTYEPVNELDVELFLASPAASQPCCNADDHAGDFEILIDPELFPGDYSTILDLQETGEWEAMFTVSDEQGKMEVLVGFEVKPADPNTTRPTSIPTPGNAATATAFAQNVDEARQSNSPLAPLAPNQSTSPLAQSAADQPASPLTSDSNQPVLAPQNEQQEGGQSEGSTTQERTSFFSGNYLMWGGFALIPIILLFFLMLQPRRDDEDDDDDDG